MPDKLRENVTAPRGMYMHRAIRKKRIWIGKKQTFYMVTRGVRVYERKFFRGSPPHHLLLYI
jgi:hypothetical protein